VSTFNPEEFARSCIEPMARHTFPFIASVVGLESENEGQLLGSAIRCTLGGKLCLVTASHVAESAVAAKLGPGYVAGSGQPPVPLTAPSLLTHAAGLAVFDVRGDNEPFWPEDRVDPNPQARGQDLLFVHGFPRSRSRFEVGRLHNQSLPYGVMERHDDLPADKLPEEFVVDFDPDWFRFPQGGAAEVVDPRGLSGSPVWRVGASEPWSASRSLLVGIVARYNPDKQVLLAVEVAALLDLVRS